MATMKVVYDLVGHNELSEAIAIERAGFHPDEAASLETFQERQKKAPEYFLGAYRIPGSDTLDNKRRLIAYVCATVAATPMITKTSMKEHVSIADGGISICIHSVCVKASWRRQGVAVGLLREFVRRCEEVADDRLRTVLLICHQELIDLYRKAGFELVGRSDVVHGPREWFEMKHVLQAAADKEEILPHSAPAKDFLAALSQPSQAIGDPVHRFSSFGVIHQLLSARNTPSNKFRIVCPREGCRSLILRPGVAKMVERAVIQLDISDDLPPANLLPPVPVPPATMKCWLITPSPMQFENIGFSKTIPRPDEAGELKLLSCSECNLGPIGWHYVGTTDFWLVCSRVWYMD